ncbi:hypothetical protein OG760_01185 [Streptomyces sp. NBC_00963]|uniref:hypothetical protein n=1 Tax=Streptomyces sp. NBC_00963 TaxID=2903697 RepID=UPI003863D7D2|nr:hypothetical protein OG760_01185 [Streptomyces sp. NBC_00963]
MSHRAALGTGHGGRAPHSHSHSVFSGPRWVRTGTEPLTAYSALGARLVLSAIALPLFAAGAALLALWAASARPAGSPGTAVLVALAAVCALFTAVSAIDIAVIRRRRAERR